MKKKIQKVYEGHGFGFPVVLLNVPMIQVRGEWLPDVNQNKLSEIVLGALIHKPYRLTGNEVHFIRIFLGMTLEQFAKRLDVTHPAVLKWEKKQTEPTGMIWSTEKDIRLFGLTKLQKHKNDFLSAYHELEKSLPENNKPIKIDLEKKSA